MATRSAFHTRSAKRWQRSQVAQGRLHTTPAHGEVNLIDSWSGCIHCSDSASFLASKAEFAATSLPACRPPTSITSCLSSAKFYNVGDALGSDVLVV